MRKIKLEMDALEVETFETGVTEGTGTVRGFITYAMDGCSAGAGVCDGGGGTASADALCAPDGGDDAPTIGCTLKRCPTINNPVDTCQPSTHCTPNWCADTGPSGWTAPRGCCCD